MLTVRRRHPGPAVVNEILVVLSFAADASAPAAVPLPEGSWRKLLDSAEERWGGAGSAVPVEIESGEVRVAPRSVLVLEGG